jgi:putative YphP/YqiW family bacilliredoxin
MAYYPIALTEPMAKDLEEAGFESLSTAEAVSAVLDLEEGTTFLVVNSVCGCAAGMARPGAKLAVSHGKRPDRIVTVFAGVDAEATQKAREYMLPYPPSSPAMALFKDGKLVHILERRNVEGNSAENLAKNLIAAFNEYC